MHINKTEEVIWKYSYLFLKTSTGLLEQGGQDLCYARADNGNNPGPKD